MNFHVLYTSETAQSHALLFYGTVPVRLLHILSKLSTLQFVTSTVHLPTADVQIVSRHTTVPLFHSGVLQSITSYCSIAFSVAMHCAPVLHQYRTVLQRFTHCAPVLYQYRSVLQRYTLYPKAQTEPISPPHSRVQICSIAFGVVVHHTLALQRY